VGGLPRPARLLAPGVLVCCLLSAVPDAAAGKDDLGATTTTIVEWHGDNKDNSDTNDDFLDVVNKLNLSYTSGILDTDLRVDTFTHVPLGGGYPKEAPAGKEYADLYRIERLTGVLRPGGGLKLTLGDFYAQFGNGMALALRKVDELGLEQVLRGARVDGSWGIFSLTLLGGVTNINNIDPQDYYFVEDPLDRLVGIRALVKAAGGRAKIGVHGVWTQPSGGEARSSNTWIVGASMDAVLVPGKLLLGTEFDWGWFEHLYQSAHPERDPENDDTGFAAYLNLRASLGKVTLLVEGKWYDAFAVEGSPMYASDLAPIYYSQPPTAERVDQEVENFHTVVGGRLKLDVRILQNLSVYANVGAGDYVSLRDAIDHATGKKDDKPFHLAWYVHAYGGLDLRWDSNRSTLSVSGGYRTEREPESFSAPYGDWQEKRRLVHGEIKLNVFLKGKWSLHASFLHEARWKREVRIPRGIVLVNYHWGTHIVGIDYGGFLSFSGAFEYDTDEATHDWYGWGLVKWFIKRNLIWSVMGGMQRGGLKCVGGVCKMVPAFAGVRTELVFRY